MAANAPTLGELRRWARSNRTWKRDEPAVRRAIHEVDRLSLFKRESAFSYFLGGATSVLENEGSISRKNFIRLLLAAAEFGERTKVV